MLSLVLSVCAAFGPSIADEAPRTWTKFYKAAQSAVAPQEPEWMTYYRNMGSDRIQYGSVFVSPAMQWAVPNYGPGMLSGPGSAPPYAFPGGFPAFPGYETPATNPPATPKK